MDQQTETLRIEGMSCGHCVRAVREALESVDGVDVDDVQVGSARLRYDPERTSRAELARAVDDAGFRLAS